MAKLLFPIALSLSSLSGCAIEVAYLPECDTDCHAGLQEEVSANVLGLGGKDDEEQ